MADDLNPYEVSQPPALAQLTFGQKLLAVGIGGLVLLASGITMTAFLFGMLIGIYGRRMPTPMDVSALFAEDMLPLSVGGATLIVVIAVFLACYSMFRVLRVQRSLLAASGRRLELARQLEAFRNSGSA